jgi:altronate dehydratase
MFTTGSGTPLGNPIAPVIKISSNTATANRMEDIIDFDAGGILRGTSVEDAGLNLYKMALEVASGKKTRNELLGHRESCYWQRSAVL